MQEEQGLIFDRELPPDHRSGFVTLAGKPNVGKSTLLNAWLGFRLVAVSPKPQTTRNRLRGILTRDDAQIIFVDTPGIHLPRNKLGEYMVATAKRAIPDADVVVFVDEAQEELMFLYQLLLDQNRILGIRGQKITSNRPPGTKFTMGVK